MKVIVFRFFLSKYLSTVPFLIEAVLLKELSISSQVGHHSYIDIIVFTLGVSP